MANSDQEGKALQDANVAESKIVDDIPSTYPEAILSSESGNWAGAMKEEMQSLNKNKTWKLAQLPKGDLDKRRSTTDYLFTLAKAPSGGVRALFRSNEVEGRKKVIENIWEHLRVVEDQCFSKENKFFGGDSVNVLDLAFGSIIKYLTVLEDIFGVQILEEHKFPHLYSWFNIFKTQPIIAQNLPHQDQMVAFVESLREQILSSSS
ncbi:probable glutathione S-transferase [Phaseolus vulgaris]|uniref:probable glutathione S-transferase n=1 Tax=Phaseolus vulgaris TaxID=3885 RepID=UPI0035C9FAE6